MSLSSSSFPGITFLSVGTIMLMVAKIIFYLTCQHHSINFSLQYAVSIIGIQRLGEGMNIQLQPGKVRFFSRASQSLWSCTSFLLTSKCHLSISQYAVLPSAVHRFSSIALGVLSTKRMPVGLSFKVVCSQKWCGVFFFFLNSTCLQPANTLCV